MGAICSCGRIEDSEDFVKKLFNSSCFLNLTKIDLDTIIISRLKGEPDYINRTNLRIAKEVFNEMAKDIYGKQYLVKRKKGSGPPEQGKDFEDKALIENFTKDLFSFLEINNNVNCLIFKLIMIPFILKNNEKTEKEFYDNVDTFYEYLSRANFSNKHNYSLSKPDMKYSQFAENFFIYLSIVLSGFTKIILDRLDLSKYSELLINDFQENINFYYKPENIRDFYTFLIKDWVKDLEEKEGFTDLNSTSITEEDFRDFCDGNKFIVDYFELRENFRKFVDKKPQPQV